MDRQRIDKWLWHARLVRTRAAAAALAGAGRVRLNGTRIGAASRPVKQGDVVTVALDRTVRVLKVTGFAERRGPAQAAGGLYQDLAPAAEPQRDSSQPPPARPGARPTKRDRRVLDRLFGDGEA